MVIDDIFEVGEEVVVLLVDEKQGTVDVYETARIKGISEDFIITDYCNNFYREDNTDLKDLKPGSCYHKIVKMNEKYKKEIERRWKQFEIKSIFDYYDFPVTLLEEVEKLLKRDGISQFSIYRNRNVEVKIK